LVAGPEAEGEFLTLEQIVSERLLTRVLVFGTELAEALFGHESPAVVAAARVHLVPGLNRLGTDRDAKRILWKAMLEQGIAAPQTTGKQRT
jgi:hypothetical protein